PIYPINGCVSKNGSGAGVMTIEITSKGFDVPTTSHETNPGIEPEGPGNSSLHGFVDPHGGRGRKQPATHPGKTMHAGGQQDIRVGRIYFDDFNRGFGEIRRGEQLPARAAVG